MTAIEKHYTIAEVAELFSVKPATVRDWLSSGKLRGAKPGGKHWRIPHSAVAELAQSKFGTSDED